MDKTIMQSLEDINKYIFVKKYQKSAKLLDELIASQAENLSLLVYLRRIELASKLDEIEALKEQYSLKIKKGGLAEDIGALCLALLDQQGELVSPTESIQRFSDLMEKYGESAAAYYGLGYAFDTLDNYERAIYSYKQSLKLDPDWYPSYFGLSQVSYRNQDQKNGDYFFYMFEKFAPYNLYGNFYTHKKLSEEFVNKKEYEEAESAIKSLSDWWVENKGICPIEIQIYENLMLAEIARKSKDPIKENSCRQNVEYQTMQILDDPEIKEEALYFIAKALEEFSEFSQAFKVYKQILKIAGDKPEMVQKIGNQFLSMGEFKLAKELFDDAYEQNPDVADIRFCRLVTDLKLAQVPVEEYIIEKERTKKIIEQEGDHVELLALLYHLLAKYNKDPEVHGYLGEVYYGLSNAEKAGMHFRRMYELDKQNKLTVLKYASFLIEQGEVEESKKVIENLSFDEHSQTNNFCELSWIKCLQFAKINDFEQAIVYLRKILKFDPWNVSYLAHEVIWSIKIKYPDRKELIDSVLERLSTTDEDPKEWDDFFKNTKFFLDDHQLDIVYSRNKLFLLYEGSKEKSLRYFVNFACKFDAEKGCQDLLRLLNTNFDSPWIYWGLGVLSKELWQLETASMWFEQVLSLGGVDEEVRNAIYIELADCYVWRNSNLQKGVEYLKVVNELKGEVSQKSLVIMSHAYLKLGLVQKAQFYLEKLPSETHSFEAKYLSGLLHYRNGSIRKAKSIWKPLLTTKSKSLRTHHIKQELLKFYFNGETYLKAN